MNTPDSPKTVLQCLNACVGALELIPPEQRQGNLPFQRYQEGRTELWVVGRGDQYFDRTNDPEGEHPFDLEPAGQLSIYIRLKSWRDPKIRQPGSTLAEYSLAFVGLSEGDGHIASLRYDFDPAHATPHSTDWDEDLHDNVAHPMFHLHVNYHLSKQANDVRLALGQVSPILVLRNFDVWYAAGEH